MHIQVHSMLNPLRSLRLLNKTFSPMYLNCGIQLPTEHFVYFLDDQRLNGSANRLCKENSKDILRLQCQLHHLNLARLVEIGQLTLPLLFCF